MKHTIVRLALVCFVAGPLGAAERIDPGLLPPAVQRTLETSAQGARVKIVRMTTLDARRVYEIDVRRPAGDWRRLRVAEDGSVLTDAAIAPDRPVPPPMTFPEYGMMPATVPPVQWREIPDSAQRTIDRVGAGRRIAVVYRDRVDGIDGFAVQYRDRGRNPWVFVADDGTLLRPAEKPPLLGIGTMFSDLPANVQQTLRREVADSEIVRITSERRAGAGTSYRVQIKGRGGIFELLLAEDGALQEDSRLVGGRVRG